MFTKLNRSILLVFIFAILIYSGLIFIADFDNIILSLQKFPLYLFSLSFLTIFISIIFKFIRWQIYVNELKLKITFIDSILVFTSGFIMSVSPGKIGELLKSFLLKHKYQIPISKSSPVVAAERIIEFTALILISLIGIVIFKYSITYLLILVAVLIAIAALLFFKKFRNILQRLFVRLPLIKKYIHDINEFNVSLKRLLSLKIFIKILFLSILAWLAEFYGFYLILSEFKNNINVFWSSFIYSLSIIIGAVSMLPGGIGITEGALTYLLIENGFTENVAIASTIIIRFITLWIPVLTGFIAMIIFTINKRSKI